MLAVLLLVLACPQPTVAVSHASLCDGEPSADEQAQCPYAFDRNRKLWLHASQVPRYLYYRVLEPGDGTRRSSMMVRVALEEESIREATFEVVTRIEDGTSSLRVVLARTIADERAGLDLSEPHKVALSASRGAGQQPSRLTLVGSERLARAGWLYETTTFEPDVVGAVTLVDARELEVSGPGHGWKPVFDDIDRAALRYFLWHHAPGARAALEASAKRRASEVDGTGAEADDAEEADVESERDG